MEWWEGGSEISSQFDHAWTANTQVRPLPDSKSVWLAGVSPCRAPIGQMSPLSCLFTSPSCWGTHFLYLSNPPSGNLLLPIIPWSSILLVGFSPIKVSHSLTHSNTDENGWKYFYYLFSLESAINDDIFCTSHGFLRIIIVVCHFQGNFSFKSSLWKVPWSLSLHDSDDLELETNLREDWSFTITKI